MEDNLKDQMTEAHTELSVQQKAEMLMHPDSETPVLVEEGFVQTPEMFEGTPVHV